MQATLKPNPLATKKNKTFLRFLLDWAAVITLVLCFVVFGLATGSRFLFITLVLCFVVFGLATGSRFMSVNNMINILRAMSITTVFGIAATVTMAPDGFDMSACTLASCSAYVFVSMYLWYGLPLWACILICIGVTLVMYQLTMFLILVCKIPDMLATCALMFVHQGLGQWYIGGGAVSTGMRLPSGASPVRTKLEDSFSAIGREPWLIVIMLVCVLIAYIFLEYTKHGRFIYAMGGNKQAAKLSGINVKAYRYLAGMITAVFIAIGGILVSSPRLFRAGHVLRQLPPDAVAGRRVRQYAQSAARRSQTPGHADRRHAGVDAGKRPDHLRRTLLRAARREGRRAGPGSWSRPTPPRRSSKYPPPCDTHVHGTAPARFAGVSVSSAAYGDLSDRYVPFSSAPCGAPGRETA